MSLARTTKEPKLPRLPIDFRTRFGPWAIITGASSGIGAEFARQLTIFGFSVVIVARRKQKLDELANMLIKKHAVQVKVIAVDLAQQDGWRTVVEETEQLDVGLLVNNAGVELHGSFFDQRVESHMNLISVNVTAASALAHDIGLRIAKRGSGGIIFVSSLSHRPTPWWATYSSSKSFVTSLGLALRNELKPKGVHVSVLEPGLVKSEMSDAWMRDLSCPDKKWNQMPVEQCVSAAMVAIVHNDAQITPGWRSSAKVHIIGALPTWLSVKITGSASKKCMNAASVNNAE